MVDRHDKGEYIALLRSPDRLLATLIPRKGGTETADEAKPGGVYTGGEGWEYTERNLAVLHICVCAVEKT